MKFIVLHEERFLRCYTGGALVWEKELTARELVLLARDLMNSRAILEDPIQNGEGERFTTPRATV